MSHGFRKIISEMFMNGKFPKILPSENFPLYGIIYAVSRVPATGATQKLFSLDTGSLIILKLVPAINSLDSTAVTETKTNPLYTLSKYSCRFD